MEQTKKRKQKSAITVIVYTDISNTVSNFKKLSLITEYKKKIKQTKKTRNLPAMAAFA